MKKSKLRHIIRKIIQEQTLKEIEDVPDKVKPDGSDEPPTPTFYCDDPEAINYTPNADPNLIDNSVCVYQNEEPFGFEKRLGCKNKNDINYCAECAADTDPTSCAGIRVQKDDDYRPGKVGCTDNGNKANSLYPGYAACNYEPEAEVACDPNNLNNDCCDYETCMGCMISSAEGYDPEATIPCPNDECCGDRRQTKPKYCKKWKAACNYGEECPEDFEGDDCCTWDCPNAKMMLSFAAMQYALGPCGPLSYSDLEGNAGQTYFQRNPNGCCSGGNCPLDNFNILNTGAGVHHHVF